MNEARIMRKFGHQNVIQFYGKRFGMGLKNAFKKHIFTGVAVGEEPLMIVMELATNGALKDYLQQHTRHLNAKLYMCMGAAAGLAHLHEKNVIHCDIAARNCLFSENKVSLT